MQGHSYRIVKQCETIGIELGYNQVTVGTADHEQGIMGSLRRPPLRPSVAARFEVLMKTVQRNFGGRPQEEMKVQYCEFWDGELVEC